MSYNWRQLATTSSIYQRPNSMALPKEQTHRVALRVIPFPLLICRALQELLQPLDVAVEGGSALSDGDVTACAKCRWPSLTAA
jgi:hypothetical protein